MQFWEGIVISVLAIMAILVLSLAVDLFIIKGLMQ